MLTHFLVAGNLLGLLLRSLGRLLGLVSLLHGVILRHSITIISVAVSGTGGNLYLEYDILFFSLSINNGDCYFITSNSQYFFVNSVQHFFQLCYILVSQCVNSLFLAHNSSPFLSYKIQFQNKFCLIYFLYIYYTTNFSKNQIFAGGSTTQANVAPDAGDSSFAARSSAGSSSQATQLPGGGSPGGRTSRPMWYAATQPRHWIGVSLSHD